MVRRHDRYSPAGRLNKNYTNQAMCRMLYAGSSPARLAGLGGISPLPCYRGASWNKDVGGGSSCSSKARRRRINAERNRKLPMHGNKPRLPSLSRTGEGREHFTDEVPWNRRRKSPRFFQSRKRVANSSEVSGPRKSRAILRRNRNRKAHSSLRATA